MQELSLDHPGPWRFADLADADLPDGRRYEVVDGILLLADAVRRGQRAFPTPAQVGLVVEVVTTSSRKTDRFAEPGEYAEAGVPLFWRVDTEPEVRFLASALDAGGYVPVGEVVEGGLEELLVPWGTVRVDLTQLPS